MKKQNISTGILASFGILILILDGKTALSGAKEGIDLCIQTVIPSLFPFFILSILLTSSLSGHPYPLLKPIGKLLAIPEGCESIFLVGIMGGYPAGAQAVATAYRSKQITKSEAEHMLAFCNNAGPAFLFGIAAPLFHDRSTGFILWGIHIAAAVLSGILLKKSTSSLPNIQKGNTLTSAYAMRSALLSMACVCGWIVLFRVLLTFLESWFLWILPDTVQVFISGLLELSNGCLGLLNIQNSAVRFLLCSVMLAWGGLCVTMQTRSVTDGLSLKPYLRGKLLQTFFSFLLSICVILNIFFPVFPLVLLLVLGIKKTQKSCRNPKPVGV